MFIRKHGSATPFVNYKTGFYANLADVTGNFVCWGEILTHEHLSIEKKGPNSFRSNDRKWQGMPGLARALCKKLEK